MIDDQIEKLKNKMVEDKSLPGPGWYSIIINLDNKLSMLDPDYKILQIKEKFGTLRYYYISDTKITSIREAMNRYVRYAEIESSKTCELCGDATMVSRQNNFINKWIKTICKNCSINKMMEGMTL